MKKKSILFISRPLSPPWDEASKNFAYSLAKNVKEIFSLAVLTTKEKLKLEKNVKQLPVYSSSELRFKQKIELFKFLLKKRKNFNIFHLFFTPAKLNIFFLKLLLNKKKLKTIQTVATLREDLYSEQEIKKLLFADQIVTYSDYSKKKIQNWGFSNVKRIYPGIDLERYQKRPKHLATLSRFGLSESNFVITFPGEYTRLGSIDEILESFEEIEKKISEARLVLACRVKNKKDFLKKQEILKGITGTELEKKIIFTDTFSDMPKLYNLSDVILFPVHNMHGKFDVPLVIPEAQACEKPVVVSDLPIFEEFALANNSVTIKRGNASEISKAILKIYENAALREELGKNGRRFVEESFDIKKIAKKYEKIYEQI